MRLLHQFIGTSVKSYREEIHRNYHAIDERYRCRNTTRWWWPLRSQTRLRRSLTLQESDTTFARDSTTVMVTPCLHNHNFLVRESGIEAGYSLSRITILHFNIVARIFDSFDSWLPNSMRLSARYVWNRGETISRRNSANDLQWNKCATRWSVFYQLVISAVV